MRDENIKKMLERLREHVSVVHDKPIGIILFFKKKNKFILIYIFVCIKSATDFQL